MPLTAYILARRYYQLPQELFVAVTNRIPPCGQNKKVCFRLNVSLVCGHCPVGFSLLPDVIEYARHCEITTGHWAKGKHDSGFNRGWRLPMSIHRQIWLIFG